VREPDKKRDVAEFSLEALEKAREQDVDEMRFVKSTAENEFDEPGSLLDVSA